MRLIYATCGLISLALGIIGAFLPLLPTVPFVLLAAFCFSRSSDRLHDWLVGHNVFGPAIRNWRESGSISARAKRLATISIGFVFVVSLVTGVRLALLLTQAVVLSLVLIFIWTRPTE